MEAPVAGFKAPVRPSRPVRAKAQRQTRQLAAGRRKALVDRCAAILRAGEPTCFAFEADCRHAIRAGLCLEGWRWHRADTEAAEIVAEALRRIGARRPDWYEGQPRWTEDGHVRVERTRCTWCGRRKPQERRLYCCGTCFERARWDRRRRDRDAYDYAARRAGRWVDALEKAG